MIPTLEVHQQTVTDNTVQIEAECKSGLCSIYYATSYFLNGMLSAVEASGDEALLEQTVRCMGFMMQTALPLEWKGITYHYWRSPNTDVPANCQEPDCVSKGLDCYCRPYQAQHFEAMIPFARAAFIIACHPTWQVKYRSYGERLCNFARHNGLEYWFDKTNGRYAPTGNLAANWSWVAGSIPWLEPVLGGSALPNTYWNDKCTLAGILAAWLAAANRQDLFCRDIAHRIATAFKQRLELQSGGWVWDVGLVDWVQMGQVPAGVDPPPKDQDTSHCNREPQFLIACNHAGIVFTQEDLQRMAIALSDRIWNGDIGDPAFTNFITGSNAAFYHSLKKYDPWQNGTIYSGWAMLGRYTPACRIVLESLFNLVLSGQTSGKLLGDKNFTAYAKVCLSGHCLLNRKAP